MDEIYSLMTILDDYCNFHSANEDIVHISHLVKIILNKIDEINSIK